MDLQQSDALSAIREICAIVANSSDMVEVFRLARRYLADIIPHDILAILVDDRQRECLTAPIAFNGTFPPDDQELVINYDNSLVSEVLITRKSQARQKLNAGQSLIKTNIRCDLLVPMCTPENVVGCFYFGRSQESPFDATEQANGELSATVLAMVLERVQTNQDVQAIRDSSNRWQERYLILLEALPYPALIVDLSTDQIIEFNEAFEQLAGYKSEELHEIEFSAILPQKSQSEIGTPTYINHHEQKVIIHHKSGKRMQLQMNIGEIPISGAEQCLLLFKPAPRPAQEPIRNLDFVFFLISCLQSQSKKNITEAVREPLDRLAVIFSVKYISVMKNLTDGTLRSVAAFQLSEGIRKDLQEPWMNEIYEEFFLKVMKRQQATFIDDVQSDPLLQTQRSVAIRLGFSALASIPLMVSDEPFGLLNLFFDSPRKWSDYDQQALTSAGLAISMVIENNQHYIREEEQSGRLQSLLQLSTNLKTKRELEDIVLSAAEATIQHIPHDLISVSLFEKPEDAEILCFGTERLANKVSQDWNWLKLNDSQFGRLTPKSVLSELPQSLIAKKYDALVSNMAEKVSVLMLAGENYLGNLTLARIQQFAFERGDIEHVRQTATLVANAINDLGRVEPEPAGGHFPLQQYLNGIRSLQHELDIDAVVYRTRKLMMEILRASDCVVKPLYEDSTPEANADIIPGVENGLVSKEEAAKLIENIIETEEPLIIENAADFFGTYGDRTGSLSWQGFGSYLLVVATKDERVTAIINVCWSERRKISPADRSVAIEIANQVGLIIANAQLYKKAVARAKEKEEFALMVAHELKAPMASVKSLTELLLDDYKDMLDDEGFRFVFRIQANLNQMENLIFNLLDYSRIGQKSRPFNYVSAEDIISRALTSLSGQIERANIVVEVAQNLPVIYCDSSALVQVFTNLISNAIKHTRDDTPKPFIKIDYISQKSYEEFVVQDNGIGIAPEYHDKIFNLFFTVAEEGNARSTGMGLAIVKKIVENHGGRIWVISSLGKGAEFHFTVPKKDILG